MMCSPVRCWSASGSGFSCSSWSRSEWQDLSSAEKATEKHLNKEMKRRRVSLHVCRWHRLQQDIQLYIKHAIVMTQCFSQQGRNVALGGNDMKRTRIQLQFLFAELDLNPLTLIPLLSPRPGSSCQELFGDFTVGLSVRTVCDKRVNNYRAKR